MADNPFYRKLREMTSLDPKIKTGSHVPLLNRITLKEGQWVLDFFKPQI